MPETSTIRRAKKAKRQGKAPSTQAGEFVREEIHHVREGKHGVRSPQQAIAIGLSKARRSGIDVGEPRAGTGSRPAPKKAASKGSSPRRRAATPSARRAAKSRVSRPALAKQAHGAAKRRGPSDRSRAAKKAARTRARTRRARAQGSRGSRRPSS